MARFMTEIIMKARSMGKGDLSGATAAFLQALLKRIILKATVFMSGTTAGSMKVSGKIIRWTGKAFSLGLTEGAMKGSTFRI